jgi:S1-C subfamily serine protease
VGFNVVQAQPMPSVRNPSEATDVAPKTPPSATALQVYAQQKEKLVQVRVLLSAANEQSSLGSAFAVRSDPRGVWYVTNYHVVAELAIDPAKYRLELRSTSGRTDKAQLMGIDVTHDLAVLLKPHGTLTAGTPSPVLDLQTQLPVQGAKVFALGNPLELGFLVSEGLYNGLVEQKLYDQMLFSGSLNSGMSGGPALDSVGRVIGVNVASRRDGEQLSFLVPARYVQSLLDASLPVAKPPEKWHDTIAKQLVLHQKNLSEAIFNGGVSTQSIGDLKLPTLSERLTRCWANSRDERVKYTISTLSCNKSEAVYVRSSLRIGSVSLSHTLMTNTKLATLQFLRASDRGSQYGSGNYTRWQGRNERTRSNCHDEFVQSMATKQVYRVATCVNAYKKFEDIYDFEINAVQVDDAKRRLVSELNMTGFSFDHAMRMTELFLKGLP